MPTPGNKEQKAKICNFMLCRPCSAEASAKAQYAAYVVTDVENIFQEKSIRQIKNQFMNDVPFIKDPKLLALHLRELHAIRVSKKKKAARKYSLTKADKIAILEKTNYKCHICGDTVAVNAFEADHVEVHSAAVNNRIDNFLPACRACNNYRWFYEPEEIKWVLKLGVWLKTQIERNTGVGKLVAEKFIQHEINRESRRKKWKG